MNLKQYDILDIYRKILTKAESLTRVRTLLSILNFDVIELICLNAEFNFALKFFEILSEKISTIYFDDDEFEICQITKYAEIGEIILNRVYKQLLIEGGVVVDNNGHVRLTTLPDWFKRMQFLVPLSVIAIENRPKSINYVNLQILMFTKETSIKRVEEMQKVTHSLALFATGNEEDEDDEFCDNYQAIILSTFINNTTPKIAAYLQNIIVRIIKGSVLLGLNCLFRMIIHWIEGILLFWMHFYVLTKRMLMRDAENIIVIQMTSVPLI